MVGISEVEALGFVDGRLMTVGIFESLPMSMVEEDEASSSTIGGLIECLALAECRAKKILTLPSLN